MNLVVLPLFNLQDLGSRLLRIGVLADPRVNTRSYNGKRLYRAANILLKKYVSKLVDCRNMDCVVLPGDTYDAGSMKELEIPADILDEIC